MTNMIQVCSNVHWAQVFIINTRPDEIRLPTVFRSSCAEARSKTARKFDSPCSWYAVGIWKVSRWTYRGTSSLIRNSPPLGPYGRPMPRALWWSYGVDVFVWARYPCSGTHHSFFGRDHNLTTPQRCCHDLYCVEKETESLLNLWRRNVNLRRPERARDEGVQTCVERDRK